MNKAGDKMDLVLKCDCCNRPIPEDAARNRERRNDVGPDTYIVTLNGHERHWLTATVAFGKWVGKEVRYVSGSGREYAATVDAIPKNPWHGNSPWPTVSLSFRDERNKLVRKSRVLPDAMSNIKRQIWRIED